MYLFSILFKQRAIWWIFSWEHNFTEMKAISHKCLNAYQVRQCLVSRRDLIFWELSHNYWYLVETRKNATYTKHICPIPIFFNTFSRFLGHKRDQGKCFHHSYRYGHLLNLSLLSCLPNSTHSLRLSPEVSLFHLQYGNIAQRFSPPHCLIRSLLLPLLCLSIFISSLCMLELL